MQTSKNDPPSCGQRSTEPRWGHPLIGFAHFLAGTGFWFFHVVIIIAALAVLLLTWCGTNIDGIRAVVATVGTLVLGVATLFAFAGWIARSTR